jgi:hypothetical protein
MGHPPRCPPKTRRLRASLASLAMRERQLRTVIPGTLQKRNLFLHHASYTEGAPAVYGRDGEPLTTTLRSWRQGIATDQPKMLTLDDYQEIVDALIVLRDTKGLHDIDREIRLIVWSTRAKQRAREVAETARKAAQEFCADRFPLRMPPRGEWQKRPRLTDFTSRAV